MSGGKAWAKRAAALLLGLALCALALEGGLFLLARLQARDITASTGGTFVVLTLGNSITKGDGAPRGAAYPEILEKHLRARHAGLNARVVNAALSNANSTVVLEQLPELLAAHRPKLVTVMTGDPNFWNRYGIEQYFGHERSEGLEGRALSLLDRLAQRSRAVRWLTLLLVRKPQEEALSDTTSVYGWVTLLTQLSLEKAWIPERKLLKMRRSFEEHAANNPGHAHVLQALVRLSLYFNDLPAADRWLAEIARFDPSFFHYQIYQRVKQGLDNSPSPRDRALLEAMMARMARAHPGEKMVSYLLTTQHKEEVAEADLALVSTRENRCFGPEQAARSYPFSLRRVSHLVYCELSQGRAGRAASALARSIEVNPYDPDGHFTLIRQMKLVVRDPKHHASLDRLRDKLSGRSNQPSRFQADYLDRMILEWVAHDLEEIRRLVHGAGAKLVLETYPPRSDNLRRPVDETIRRFSVQHDLPLADHWEAMQRWHAPGREPSVFYSKAFGPRDHHLHVRGHEEVAENLYQTLLNSGLIPKN